MTETKVSRIKKEHLGKEVLIESHWYEITAVGQQCFLYLGYYRHELTSPCKGDYLIREPESADKLPSERLNAVIGNSVSPTFKWYETLNDILDKLHLKLKGK